MNLRFRFASLVILLSLLGFSPAHSQDEKQVKNIIMLIPDGTSVDVLSLSRWYKYGICKNDACWLNIDPYICGLVKTHSSNAPIGDSAPTSSTYATGYLSQTGFIATYPPVSGKGRDLVPIDPAKAYQPLFTILEAAKLNGKSTGLVFTCQFPHATPADFSAHTPRRDRYDDIAKQMVYNHLNVVLGGGTNYLSPEHRDDKENLVEVLKERNYKYVTTKSQFQNIFKTDSLVWGLFAPDALPNDLETDKTQIPSLAEMTQKALDVLGNNKKGFFLMVEGSKVDWSAHNNDPIGIVTEFLAFDEAVKRAMDFARKDGNTAVVICPDHGNSGISIGGPRATSGYDTLSIASIILPLRGCKLTADGLSSRLSGLKTDPEINQCFKSNMNMSLTPEEINVIKAGMGTSGFTRTVARVISAHTYIGFTTNGHTGEDVFLANYHPNNYRLSGVVQNVSINKYFREISGNVNLDSLTEKYYCRDSIALKDFVWNIADRKDSGNKVQYARLIIRKNAGSSLRAELNAYTDYMTIFDGEVLVKKIPLQSLIVYNYLGDERDTKNKGLSRFYCPRDLGIILKEELLR